ncbi:hypothetical protein L195_g029504 [Trifolium pratense]|uniref:Uncharacterized protein n=1 Tax=Trifolium pratense TaxID=57577 RepID=A0A2K3L4Y1_TRIPR|nr:hypothetical protein L195_g029504 [Trifolium pratense]
MTMATENNVISNSKPKLRLSMAQYYDDSRDGSTTTQQGRCRGIPHIARSDNEDVILVLPRREENTLFQDKGPRDHMIGEYPFNPRRDITPP